MRNMISLTVAGLAFLMAGTGATANAAGSDKNRDWYVLNMGNGQCVEANSVGTDGPMGLYPSPALQSQYLRANGIIDDLKVIKDQNGDVVAVDQFFKPSDSLGVLHWFPSQTTCLIGQIYHYVKGEIPDPKDVR